MFRFRHHWLTGLLFVIALYLVYELAWSQGARYMQIEMSYANATTCAILLQEARAADPLLRRSMAELGRQSIDAADQATAPFGLFVKHRFCQIIGTDRDHDRQRLLFQETIDQISETAPPTTRDTQP